MSNKIARTCLYSGLVTFAIAAVSAFVTLHVAPGGRWAVSVGNGQVIVYRESGGNLLSLWKEEEEEDWTILAGDPVGGPTVVAEWTKFGSLSLWFGKYILVRTHQSYTVRIPLLLLSIIMVLPSSIALVAMRRYRLSHHLCVRCGYNLFGNISGTCPECGHSTQEMK